MATKETEKFRKLLRKQIYQHYPHLGPDDIFNDLVEEGHSFIPFEKLSSFCHEAGIPEDQLPYIFYEYDIFTPRLLKKQWKKFLEDELDFSSLSIPINPSITPKQKEILATFCQSIRSKRTQAVPPLNEKTNLSNERSLISYQWIFCCKYNPDGTETSNLRVAALLRIADEMQLQVDLSDLVDSIFAFFGKKIDELNFTQFANLIEAFA